MKTIIRGGDVTESGECGTCDVDVCCEELCPRMVPGCAPDLFPDDDVVSLAPCEALPLPI
jgi:hypothetical protein